MKAEIFVCSPSLLEFIQKKIMMGNDLITYCEKIAALKDNLLHNTCQIYVNLILRT